MTPSSSARRTPVRKLSGLVRSPLVGRWFHSFDANGRVHWQGQVVAVLAGEMFLVERYDWLFGTRSTAVLVPLSRMAGWAFYRTRDEMNAACPTTANKSAAGLSATHLQERRPS